MSTVRTRALVASAIAVLCLDAHVAFADAQPPAPPERPVPSAILYSSAGVGSILAAPHAPAPAVQGTFHLNFPFGHWVAVELLFTAGYANIADDPNVFWGRIAAGVRVEKANQRFSPYGAFRLLHMHYATAETWWEHPGASIAGSSAEGLQHSSGMALAGGVTWGVPHTHDHLRAMVELELSWVPIGNAPEWFSGAEVGFGYSF